MKPITRSVLIVAALSAVVGLSACKAQRSTAEERRAIQTTVDQVEAAGPYSDSSTSLQTSQVPRWYEDAKFGIGVNWGVYSVPAFGGDQYPRNMYMETDPAFQYHLRTYGPHLKFGYKDLIPLFKGEKLSAERLAGLFQKAGARYVVPVAEHSDGFAMYASVLNEWNAVRMGPKRDVIGLLAKAVRARNLPLGLAYSRAGHWYCFEGGMQFDSDVKDPDYAAFYLPAQPRLTGFGDISQPDLAFMQDWIARGAEIIDKYQPQILCLDDAIDRRYSGPYLRKLAAFYYNRAAQWGEGVVITSRSRTFPEAGVLTEVERRSADGIQPRSWQASTSVSSITWGYSKNDHLRPVNSIIDELADVVSKNGLLLLGVGPQADGTLPGQVESMLMEIGRWLSINGEAIYGTRPWKLCGEGPTTVPAGQGEALESRSFSSQDIRFTAKNGVVYAITLAWPENRKLLIKSMAGHPVKNVRLLGSAASVKWTTGPEGLAVELPAKPPCDYAFSLKIE
jgi:alpha-L-fucosidase